MPKGSEGLDFTEDLFNPFLMRLEFLPRMTRSIVAAISEHRVEQVGEMREAELRRRGQVVSRAPVQDPLLRSWVRAADNYVVDRGSGKSEFEKLHEATSRRVIKRIIAT